MPIFKLASKVANKGTNLVYETYDEVEIRLIAVNQQTLITWESIFLELGRKIVMSENPQFILSIGIFVAVYALIDRAVVAFSGAVIVVLVRIISQEDAFLSIDFNTIGLLISMMIIVMIMRRTGIFEYMAVKMVKASKAEPFRLLIFMCLTTGILSAFLDNVTIILLILPITMSVTKDLKLEPIPFIIAEIFASNVGGTATLIGDPPNIMIGSATGLHHYAIFA